MYPQVFRYAATVFAFWWVVLSGWAWWREGVGWEIAGYPSLLMLMLVTIGFAFGVALVVVFIVVDRRSSVQALGATNVRGLKCTIGEAPLNAMPPRQSVDLPNFEALPDIPPAFYPSWLDRYRASHPCHADLASAMLKVYEAHRDLPATHVKGGHGGRSLLQHSLLVAYQMQQLAPKWSYTGLRDKTGKRVVLQLRDDNYRFDPVDPLIVLVGLAHDIGKIEAFIWKDDEIVGSLHEHDLIGARVLARLPEIWAIPDEDRRAILLGVAHYHHPMDHPLSPDRRAVDDRTIALMELLIKADFVASAIENKGVHPSDSDYEMTMDHRSEIQETDESVWEAFVGILEEAGRINSPDPRHNLGCICFVTGQSTARLVLREDAIRGALMRRLGMVDAVPLGDGRYPLTMRLLRILDQKELLVRRFQELEYAAESAFWEIDFFGVRRGSTKEVKITGWSSCIVVRPTVTKYVSELPSYGWAGHIIRGTLGKARALKLAAASPAAAAEASPSTGENESGSAATPAAATAPSPMPPADAEDRPIVPRVPSGDLELIPLQRPAKAKSRDKKKIEGSTPHRERAATAPPAAGPKSPDALRFPPPIAAEDFVIRAEEQGVKQIAPRRTVVALSPHALKTCCAEFLRQETPQIASTGKTGREVYLISGPALTLRIPNVDWSGQAPLLKSASQNDARYSDFMVHEAGGIFYLVVDVEGMRSFMANEAQVPEPSDSQRHPAASPPENESAI